MFKDSRSNSWGCREIWFCLKWTKFGMVSAAVGKDWGVESTANWVQVHLPAFETRYFYFCHSWHYFVQGFFQRWCCRQRLRGYLCDFSLRLSYCYIRNWDCVHNRNSCILDLNMLNNRSQGGFNKIVLICTWHWCHWWKFQTYSFGTCLFYRTRIKASV